MMHYTKEIVLEEVTASAFDRMKEYWNLIGFNTRDDSIQARIRGPLMWPILSPETRMEDYCRFIEFLLENRWLDQINVNDRGTWVKRYSRKIDAGEARRLAEIAAQSTIKRNYFDIRFKDPAITEPVNRPLIEFREHQFGLHDTRIVGYQTIVPVDYTHLFNVYLQEQDFFSIQGIWVPEDFLV